MKRVIIKEGYFQEIAPKTKKKIDNGLDLNSWLRFELKRIGVSISDPCCNDGPITAPGDSDTRLSNPHMVGNTLFFDLYNVVTNTTIPNAASVALPGDVVSTINIVGTNLVYTSKNGITTTLSLPANPLPPEIENVFPSLNSGTTVTLTNTPTNLPFVFRNGRYQREGGDYTRVGTVLTFGTAFGISGGASGAEEVVVRYNY